MSDIKVSILCLVYNHSSYIRKALNGFVMQKTSFAFEVLIHDDASTDGTQDIIREYEQKYPDLIKPIYQKENQYSQHVSIARSFQHPRASGKYFAYCEGDDYWTDPYKLQKQFDIMESNPDVSLCTHTVQCMNEDDTYNQKIIPDETCGLKQSKKVSQDDFANFLFTKGYIFHTSSYFIRREVALDYSLFDKLTMNGDEKILRSALLKGNIYYINEVMSHRRLFTKGNYNQRFNSSSNEYKINHFLSFAKGEIAFEGLSNNKYHRLISNRVYTLLLSMPLNYGLKNTRKKLNEIMSNYKYIFGISKKNDLFYLLYKFTPHLYVPIRRLLYKLKNGESKKSIQ